MSSRSAASDRDITSGVSKLSLKAANSSKSAKAKKEEVADSWEDEDVESDTETETETQWRGAKPSEGHPQGTSAPPPTPISPSHFDRDEYDQRPLSGSAYRADAPSSSSRPEKTDAVARRMIAGALGLKAPKLTDEQKAYQAAIKEKERKRREEQKAAEKARDEEAAKARAAMWED